LANASSGRFPFGCAGTPPKIVRGATEYPGRFRVAYLSGEAAALLLYFSKALERSGMAEG
jgi:hypothetical protein